MAQSMIVDAVKAQLPLIVVRTRDLLNVEETLEYEVGIKPTKVDSTVLSGQSLAKIKEGSCCIFYPDEKTKLDYTKMYNKFLKANASLVVVNAPTAPPEAFDAGEIEPSREQVRNVLIEAYENEEFVEKILPALGGLSLKEVGEVIRLAEARYNKTNPQTIMQMRAFLVPDMPGFSAVNTNIVGPYLPNEELALYAHDNKALFLSEGTDQRLVPKGLLFDGPSGTGKTQGAKWLANEWGVPLYKLDSTILNKYYGESEQNLRSVFARVAHEAPCILFLDEVEKMFGHSGNEGGNMMGRLLGMLLWFMQEGTDRVFVAMTSNRRELLPAELLRPGRLDQVLTFKGLIYSEGLSFATTIAQSFAGVKIPSKELKQAIEVLYKSKDAVGGRVSHADVTEQVHSLVKKALNQQQGG